MLAAGVEGVDAYEVQVEVSVMGGVPGTRVIGLPDAALREARDRVSCAIRASGYPHLAQQRTIHLAPARRRKEEGSAFDLPAALALLAAEDPPILRTQDLRGIAALGELSLQGETRPIRGALAAGEALSGRVSRLFVSRASAHAAALGARGRIEVIPVDSLRHAVGILNRALQAEPITVDVEASLRPATHDDDLDLVDVRGAQEAKQALLVAAAGGHDLLFVGPPGAGKTMLARRLPGLLPPLTPDEALEVTRIHDLALGPLREELIRRRPFRAPHHTASYAALVGGGSRPRPGEISLAHKGVLFLDELPECSLRSLEALREPLESRSITVARSRASLTYPADFQLVAAMNPCPCGYIGEPRRACRCAPLAVERYAARLSGPLLDRIDLQARLSTPSFAILQAPPVPRDGAEGTAALRARASEARSVQLERAGCLNARIPQRHLHRLLAFTPEAKATLRQAAESRLMSGRGLAKVQRVSQTLADLDGRSRISSDDVAMAVHLRVGAGLLAA